MHQSCSAGTGGNLQDNDHRVHEKLAYRDAESAKKPNDLNQAIKSTIVATNEWKYHAEVIAV